MSTNLILSLSREESAALCQHVHFQAKPSSIARWDPFEYELSIDSTGKGCLILRGSLTKLQYTEGFAAAIVGRSEKLPLETMLRILSNTSCGELLRVLDMKDFGIDVTKNDNYTTEYHLFLDHYTLCPNDAKIVVQVDFQPELHAPVDFEVVASATKLQCLDLCFEVISSAAPTREMILANWSKILDTVNWGRDIGPHVLIAEKEGKPYKCKPYGSDPRVRLSKILPCKIEIRKERALWNFDQLGHYDVVVEIWFY